MHHLTKENLLNDISIVLFVLLVFQHCKFEGMNYIGDIFVTAGLHQGEKDHDELIDSNADNYFAISVPSSDSEDLEMNFDKIESTTNANVDFRSDMLKAANERVSWWETWLDHRYFYASYFNILKRRSSNWN